MSNKNVIFKEGTQSDYDSLISKDSSTLYFTEDTHRLYKGGSLIGGSGGGSSGDLFVIVYPSEVTDDTKTDAATVLKALFKYMDQVSKKVCIYIYDESETTYYPGEIYLNGSSFEIWGNSTGFYSPNISLTSLCIRTTNIQDVTPTTVSFEKNNKNLQAVNIRDPDGYYSVDTVEGALKELGEFKDNSEEVEELIIDTVVTQNSSNLITSGGVYTALDGLKATARRVEIAVSDWAGGTTCTKSVAGVTSTSIVIVDTSDGNVECTDQGNNTLTFTAASTPTSVVTAKVVIL